MTSTHIAIQDSEALLDLMQANLLGPVFQLSFTFLTTELLWRELGASCQKAVQPHVVRNKLVVTPCDCEQQAQVVELSSTHQDLSLAECSVYCLAKANGWPMLAPCTSLLQRKYVPPLQLHDMTWLLQQLIKQSQLTRATALAAAQRLSEVNPRLRVERAMLLR